MDGAADLRPRPCCRRAVGAARSCGAAGGEGFPGGLSIDAFDVFRQGLRDHGYVEGQTIVIEWRFAEGSSSRLANLAAKLVRLKVNLLFAEGTPAAQAAKRATATILIVFRPIADPDGSGLVANLARPDGNITGLTFMAQELGGKRLELLKEAVPGMTRVGVLSHGGNPSEATRRAVVIWPLPRRDQKVASRRSRGRRSWRGRGS